MSNNSKNITNKTTNSINLLIRKIYSYCLSAGGALGLIAMTWQASERIHMLKYPNSVLSCNLSPIVDCGSVLGNKLAALFGFPNAFLGMAFFAILMTSGLLLLAGGEFIKWFRHFVFGVSIALIGFSVWFLGVSLYVINKICIFCAVGWIVSIPIFWYGLIYYLQSFKKKSKNTQKFIDFALRHHLDVVVAVYVLMIILFLTKFKDYYFG